MHSVLLHAKSLKMSWQVFAEHRAVFFDIFADQTESTRAVPLLTWEKTAAGTRRWQFSTPDDALVQMPRSGRRDSRRRDRNRG